MNDQNVNLRVKCKAGQQVISKLSLSLTIDQLKEMLSKLSDIPVRNMKVLLGYPPQILDMSRGNDSLHSLNLRSGDTLIVEEDLQPVTNGVAEGGPPTKTTHDRSVGDTDLHSAKFSVYQRSSTSHVEQGILTRRLVPPNNSCLFTAIDYVINDGARVNLESAKPMRRIVSKLVSSNPEKFNEGFLGRTNSSYCAWIIDDRNWGGAIEVSILAEHYCIEIAVIDAQTGRINRFGEAEGYDKRVFLFYDGTHYDPVAYENIDGTAVLRTKFSTSEDDHAILAQAMDIGQEAKNSRQFTDLHSGVMQCLDCKVFVRGEAELQKHSMKTGHVNYSEVR